MISAERRISPSQRRGETGRPSLQEVIELMQKEYMHRQAEAICNKQQEIQVDDGADQSVNPAPTSLVIDIPHEGQDTEIRPEEMQVDDGHTTIDIGEATGDGHGNGTGGQDGDTKNKAKSSEPTEPSKSFSPLDVNASDLMALLAIETKPEGGQTTVNMKEAGKGEQERKDAKRPGRRLRERTRRERFMDAAGDVWWEIKYSFKHPPLWVFFLLAFVFMVLFLVGIGLTFFHVGDPSHGSSADVVEAEQITVDIVDGDSFTDGQAPLELESLEEAWGPGDHPPGQ